MLHDAFHIATLRRLVPQSLVSKLVEGGGCYAHSSKAHYSSVGTDICRCASTDGNAQDQDRIPGVAYFRLAVNGGFLSKMGNELGGALLPLSKGACKFFKGSDCSDVELAVGAPIPYILAQGRVNTNDTQQGAFRAPDGYQFCRVQVNAATGSISEHATFTGTLQDNRQQMAFLLHVNANIPVLRQGADRGQSANSMLLLGLENRDLSGTSAVYDRWCRI